MNPSSWFRVHHIISQVGRHPSGSFLKVIMPNISLLISTLLVALTWFGASAFNFSLIMENYPTPFTAHNRVVGFLLAYNFYHIDPIIQIVNDYVSMCEGGWDPTIVFFTTVNWSPTLLRYFRQKSYCYRKGGSLNFEVSQHNASIGTGLGSRHREEIGNYIDKYDVFVYHEDDIVFTFSHLTAYLQETKKLHQLLPEGGLWDNTIGFQRYRRLFRGNNINQPYGEQDIFEQELLEETPEFVPVCIKEKPYIHVQGNTHQGMWVFTRQQIYMLQEKCVFMNQSSASREYMSSFSLFYHKKYHCGLNKLLPPTRLYTFAILHYYQQRHVSWIPVFTADENIRAGFHSRQRTPVEVPPCWKTIVEHYQAEQAGKPVPKILV